MMAKMWDEEDIERYEEGEFTNPYCSNCHLPCKPIHVDNGYEASHHVWQTVSKCCDDEVVEGFDCRWCELFNEGEHCPEPCPHNL